MATMHFSLTNFEEFGLKFLGRNGDKMIPRAEYQLLRYTVS